MSSRNALFFLATGLVLSGCASGDVMSDDGELIAAPAAFVVTKELTAVDGQESALANALRDEAGRYGTSYAKVHVDVDDPRHFLTLAIWQTRAAFEDSASPALTELVADVHQTTYTVEGSLDLRRIVATADDPNAIYTVVFAKTATEEGRREFLRLQAAIIPLSRTQDGNRFYDFFRATEPGTVASYEAWATPAAEQLHLSSAPLVAFASQVGPLLAGPPRFLHFKTIAR